MIAARKSDLARLQAYQVGAALRAKNPKLEIVFHFRESLGDREQSNPLWQMPEKGVFTEDFVEGLVQGEFDLVVHSWKDLPTQTREKTEIVATLPRADMRDVLLVRRDVFNAGKEKWRVLSSSPRRAHFLGSAWSRLAPAGSPPLEFQSVRGNIPTRLLKLKNGEGEALLVAKAALDRLLSTKEDEFADARRVLREVLDGCKWMVLPVRIQPPAPGQGALAIEIARHRADLREILRSIHCPTTFENVQWERSQLTGFGGGCHLKIGAAALSKDSLRLRLLQGLPPSGAPIEQIGMVRSTAPSFRGPICALRSADLFDVKSLPTSGYDEALYIAHTHSLPPCLPKDSFLWTSGLKTWEELASRGYWVNGSDESLGEEVPSTDALAGRRLPWIKITHADSLESVLPTRASYELVPKDVSAQIHAKVRDARVFYWHSGTLFNRALEIWPEIREAVHCCGWGLTRKTLQSRLGSLTDAQIFLDEADCRMFYEGAPHERVESPL
jgi:hydroxymethylbilane synthase